jgi:hypothetical protein
MRVADATSSYRLGLSRVRAPAPSSRFRAENCSCITGVERLEYAARHGRSPGGSLRAFAWKLWDTTSAATCNALAPQPDCPACATTKETSRTSSITIAFTTLLIESDHQKRNIRTNDAGAALPNTDIKIIISGAGGASKSGLPSLPPPSLMVLGYFRRST